MSKRPIQLQRRHLEFIADTIASAKKKFGEQYADDLVTDMSTIFADACKGTNEQFDRDKFIARCHGLD